MNLTIVIPAIFLLTVCGVVLGGWYMFFTGVIDTFTILALLMPKD